jgi:hypothetical protein
MQKIVNNAKKRFAEACTKEFEKIIPELLQEIEKLETVKEPKKRRVETTLSTDIFRHIAPISKEEYDLPKKRAAITEIPAITVPSGYNMTIASASSSCSMAISSSSSAMSFGCSSTASVSVSSMAGSLPAFTAFSASAASSSVASIDSEDYPESIFSEDSVSSQEDWYTQIDKNSSFETDFFGTFS